MLKVYLVDDEKPIIDELLAIIDWESIGCEVCGYSTDSLDALEEIARLKPDLLISDISMSGLNGLELVSKILPRLPDLGVILLTAYDLFDYAVDAIRLRVLSYLIKPVNRRELIEVIANFRYDRACLLFRDFFSMALNLFADEKIIKYVEQESLRLGYIQTGKRYAFSYLPLDEKYSGVVAEYRAQDVRFALIDLQLFGEDLAIKLNAKAFIGGENFYRVAKDSVLQGKTLREENKVEKEIKIVIDSLLKDIEDNYSEKVSLGYYAQKYHYNLTYLSQQFKLYVGMNFIDYVIKVRLNKAKELMKEKGLSMNEIAYKLGYDDYSHFSKIFKKYEGLSPAEYRKNYC